MADSSTSTSQSAPAPLRLWGAPVALSVFRVSGTAAPWIHWLGESCRWRVGTRHSAEQLRPGHAQDVRGCRALRRGDSPSYDLETHPTAKPAPGTRSQETVEQVLPGIYVGEIEQRPTEYSALRVGGVRAYRSARAGQAAWI